MKQKSCEEVLSLCRDYWNIPLYGFAGAVDKLKDLLSSGELSDELAKLGYRKVRSVRISFLDGAGFGYTNQDGCFQLLADNTEMFIPVEEK